MAEHDLMNQKTFEAAGYATIPNFLDEARRRALEELLDAHLEKDPTRKETEDFIYARGIFKRDLKVRELLLQVFRALSWGRDLQIVRDEIVVKLPKKKRSYPWHQDVAYFPDNNYLTAFIALTDAGPDRGTVSVIPHSHKLGALSHIEGKLGLAIEDSRLLDGEIPLQLKAGTLVLIDPKLIHRGVTNLSPNQVKSYVLVTTVGA
jgi:hypothetical protein